MIKAIYVNHLHELAFVGGLDEHVCEQKALSMIKKCNLVYKINSELLNNRDLKDLKQCYIKKYKSKSLHFSGWSV